jgi:Calcineurin-like phosphoesterase
MRRPQLNLLWQSRAASVIAVVLLGAATAFRPLRAAEPRCEFTGVDRIVAIGDVHGAYQRFIEILRASGVLDDRLRWVGGRTHLVQLGDVVDRGPDSLQSLDLLERLQKDAARAGGAVHPLLGNHEVMRLLGDERYVTPGEYEAFATADSSKLRDAYLKRAETLKEPVAEPPALGFVEMRLAFGRNGRYGKWLRSLNTVVQIDGVVFVHGGISQAVAGLSCEAINTTVRREITDDIDQTRADPRNQLATRTDGPLWYRGLADEPEAFAPAVDEILARQHARAIVIAHTVTADKRIRARFGGKVVQMDTGMQPAYMPDGRASALEITKNGMTAIYADSRETLVEPALAASPSR